MEVDTMEILERLVINIFLFFFLFSCDNRDNLVVINNTDIHLDLSKRYVEYKKKIFSGLVIKFYKNTNDTLSVSIFKNGLKDNTWKKFYKNGNIKERRK